MAELTLEDLMRQFQPSPEEQQRARMQALMAAGFSLLGAPRGREWQAIGNAGFVGMNALGAQQQAAQQQKMQQLLYGAHAMDLAQKYQAMKDQQELRNLAPGQISPAGGAASIAPNVPALADVSAPPAAAPADLYSQAIAQIARFKPLADRGNAAAQKMIDHYTELALKAREKFGGPQVEMVDNKPTLRRYGEYGGERTVTAAQPKPEFQEINRGGQVDLVNKLIVPATGASFNVTNTPYQNQQLANEAARIQLARNADARAAANEGQPQIVPTPDGLFAVNKQTGVGKPVVGPDGQPLASSKALTEAQAKATAYANQMADASQKIAALAKRGFTGSGAIQQGQIVNAASEGIPYVPFTAIVPRAAAGADAQKYQQAELQWTEGALRFMTGANAPKEEVIRNAATYFPRPGDSDEVIAQKAQARRNMEESVRLAAGAGNKQLPSMPQAEAPLAPPKIGEVRRGYRYKGGDPAQRSSWQEVQ